MPAVLVQVPEKVWVNPLPKFNVPPDPLIVSPAPVTFPINVAVPDVLVMETRPVVVNPSILCVVIVPVITIGEAFATKVPSLLKLPPRVKLKLLDEVFKVAPLLIVRGTEALKTLASSRVIVPVLAITTPPVAAKGVLPFCRTCSA